MMLQPAQKELKTMLTVIIKTYNDLQIKEKTTFFLTNNEKQSHEDGIPFQSSSLHCQTNITHKIKVIVLKPASPLLTSHLMKTQL